MQWQNIQFTPLTFTKPGVHSYTIRELTPSDMHWTTDGRAYRAVVTVTENGKGTLDAHVNYTDGFPQFVNVHACPPPPCEVCKFFDCLPFPMWMFSPPQKAEFKKIMETAPDVFRRWDEMVHYLRNFCNK